MTTKLTKIFVTKFLVLSTLTAEANSISLDLKITGKMFNFHKSIELGPPGSVNSVIDQEFKSFNNNAYFLKLEQKKLPDNRSYPKNLDLSISDSTGKIGYLFFALNDLSFLQKIGEFGIQLETTDGPAKIQIVSQNLESGSLLFHELGKERFFQDTLLENKGFQMIRPVTLPLVNENLRHKEFNLDSNPYSVAYSMHNLKNGIVRFEHNFFGHEGKKLLLFGVYFKAKSLADLREVMFAAKYYRSKDSPSKIVFYPALGQTEPVAQE